MGKESKKQLKTLITFSSPTVYEKVLAEANTSALAEALFARHFGIEIEGDSPQAQMRRDVLANLPGEMPRNPVVGTPATPSRPDDLNDEDGLIEDEADEPLELPDVPAETTAPTNSTTAEVGVAKETKVEEPLPDRPADYVVNMTGGFEPVQPGATSVPVHTPQVESKPAPPPPVLQTVGARLCPNCGNDMGKSPHCLICL